MSKKLDKLARQLLVSGDPNRLKIICLLFDNRKICVSEIANNLGLDIAVTSYHLQVLTKAKLTKPIREGKEVCYLLENSDFANNLKNLIC
jgi:DNA-binding transcriptional ArsR family regulator